MKVIGKILKFIFISSIVIFIGMKIFLSNLAEHRAQERAVAQSKISPSEILVSNLKFTPLWGSDTTATIQVTGRITNNSRVHSASYVDISLTAADCSTTPCAVVGAPSIEVSTTVPPGQARDFSYQTSIGVGIGSIDRVSWKYIISSVTAN
jgi:hypothetical protein